MVALHSVFGKLFSLRIRKEFCFNFTSLHKIHNCFDVACRHMYNQYNVPVKLKLEHPPPSRAAPWAFEVLENFCLNPPSPGRKAVQMHPSPRKFPDYFFNFSLASIVLLRLCMLTWFIRLHIFIYCKDKSFSITFKYGTQLVWAFGFQPVHHMYAIFSFEFIKICLRSLCHDLSAHVESARFVT